MIHDYKFDRKLRDRVHKPRKRHSIFIGGLMGMGVLLAAMGMQDTNALTSPQESSAVVPPSLIEMEKETIEVVSQPLVIPGQREPLAHSGAEAGKDAPIAHSDQAPSLLVSEQPLALAALVPDKPRSDQRKPESNQAEEDQPSTTVPEVVEVKEEPAAAVALVAPGESLPKSIPETKTSLKRHQIAKGETLTGIFERYDLSQATLFRLLNTGKEGQGLSRIRPGQELEFDIAPDGRLNRLVLVKSPIESLHFSRDDEKFSVELKNRKIEGRTASVSGTIESSLFLDGQKAGLSDNQIMELAEIFGWDIDFALEIRAGDQFRVIYEEQFVDGEKYRNGPILAAEFVNRGTTHQAFRYENKDRTSYYDADGRSKRRAFIRTPLRFARISSRFQPKRWHPVLKKWKAHKGVDYAAPTGTAIKATGDGRVIFRGWQKGYGRVVIVQHSSKYKTVYAHMSKFRSKVKKGSRVKQGQVIGYVGASGWATGPHLHYEFRVNNVKRNPLTVDLPKSLPLPKAQLARYKQSIAPLTQKLASIRPSTMVASASN